jgi:hypothetical protein
VIAPGAKQSRLRRGCRRRDRGTAWAELLRLLVCERRAGVSGLRANARRGLGGCHRVGGVDEDCRTVPANRASAVAEPRRRRAVSRPSRALQACKQQPNGTPSDCRSPAQTSRHPACSPIVQSAGPGHRQSRILAGLGRAADPRRAARRRAVSCLAGNSREPSFELEPTTPSLPWKVHGVTGVHGRPRTGTKSLQIPAKRSVRPSRPKNGRGETGGRKMDGTHVPRVSGMPELTGVRRPAVALRCGPQDLRCASRRLATGRRELCLVRPAPRRASALAEAKADRVKSRFVV